MKFEEFVKETTESIKSYLPKEYEDAEIIIQKVKKQTIPILD